MNIELINTGSELMLGAVLNTHQLWLCRQLTNLGYPVTRQVAVPDSAEVIRQVVAESLARADVVITTGGLGPTADDLTRDAIAEMLGKRLREDPTVLTSIEKFFAERQRPLPPKARVQALVPDGAIVLPNQNGTAPGLVMEVRPGQFRASEEPGLLIMLPGPPRELRPMFEHDVVPLLQHKFLLDHSVVCRTFQTTGLGESLVEEKIEKLLQPLIEQGLELGYCARHGEVDVRVIARGAGAEALADQAAQVIQDAIGQNIFSSTEETLEAVILRLLAAQEKTLAIAESCTGGYISHRLTNIAGASAAFINGLVTYSDESKQRLLGVRAETLAAHGAVSEATAREMAEGARSRSGTDYALAVTGIAGPTGGGAGKPVGTVFIALAGGSSVRTARFMNPYDRKTFKRVTSRQALELLRQTLLAH